MRRKLYLETFGCQMNVLDSELVLGQLRAHGYELVDNRDQADVILYNTCSVREHAEQKVYSRLGELRPRKAADPGLIIGVIGCMVERDGVNLFKRNPHVDLLCGPGELDKLAAMVHNASVTADVYSSAVARAGAESDPTANAISAGESNFRADANSAADIRPGDRLHTSPAVHPALVDLPKRQRQVALMGASTRRSSTLAAAEDHLEMLDLSRSFSPGDDLSQAYVRITRGCNKFCTYCVVPNTRGPEVHRPPGNIIDEVKKLTDAGAREVTLLGQTINHYTFRHGDGRVTTFADLLYQIHEATPDLPRLRFVTSFPRDFTDQALQAMRDCPRICRYLHVPAQHGSDRILKLMNRGYTAQLYRDFVARAREMMPDICLASDFIVGFPTETDEDFQLTVDLLRECRFKNSFIFKYSPRPGTVAIDRFTDDIPEEIKRRRNTDLLAAQQEVSTEENRRMIGKTVSVMVEGQSKLISKREVAAANGVELGWEKRAAVMESQRTQMIGRSRGDQVVAFEGSPALKGEILELRIIDARNLTLFGEMI